jgi:hypothetical protein
MGNLEEKIMELVTILVIQFILIVVGYLITQLLNITNKIESIGLSYLFGSSLITILFLINHFLFKVSLGPENFLISVVSSIIVMYLLLLYNKKAFSVSFSPKYFLNRLNDLNCLERMFITIIVLIVGYTLSENYFWPITDWDAIALYDFRAKVISIQGNMLEGTRLGYFFQYPPYTSFLHVFGYIFDTSRVKIVYSFIYLSFLLVFYTLLRRKQPRFISILGVLFLSLNTQILTHATMAYTNLSYVSYISIVLIYLTFWLYEKKRQDLIIGMILIAMSTWVRATDPFWYLGLLILFIGMFKNKKDIKYIITLFIITIFTYKFWDIYLKTLPNPTIRSASRESLYLELLFNKTIFSKLSNIPEVLLYFYNNVIVNIKYLLPLSIFTVYYDFKENNKLNLYFYILFVISLLIIVLGIFVFSLFYETWNLIGDSLQRLSMVIIPIFIFIIFNSSVWKEDVFKNK